MKDGNSSRCGLRYWVTQPLDAFQQGVSTGTASKETAKICLELQLRKCLDASITEPGAVIDTEDTGSAMLSWLWSSGMEESGQYLKDPRFISLLTIFLVIEQRYDIIYKWFSQLQNQGVGLANRSSQKWQTTQPGLLVQLVRSEMAYGTGLGAAMVHFTQYFHRKGTDSASMDMKIYAPAGNFLAHKLADSGRAAAVPKDILSSFMETARGWADPVSLASVILHVYHPDKPRADIALRSLKQLTPDKLDRFSSSHRHDLIHASLKAAELLLARNQETGARWIMNFIQTHFADEVGARDSATQSIPLRKKSLADEEGVHLRLLENLGVH